jgi:hypothetical protein
MECSLTIGNTFECKDFAMFHPWKKSQKNVKLSSLSWTVACCNRLYLLVLNFKCSRRILCSVLCGMFNCQTACLIDFMSFCESRLNFFRLNSSDVSPPGAFSYTDVASLTKQFTWLVSRHSYWWLPARHHVKSPFQVAADVLAFTAWDAIVQLWVKRFMCKYLEIQARQSCPCA